MGIGSPSRTRCGQATAGLAGGIADARRHNGQRPQGVQAPTGAVSVGSASEVDSAAEALPVVPSSAASGAASVRSTAPVHTPGQGPSSPRSTWFFTFGGGSVGHDNPVAERAADFPSA